MKTSNKILIGLLSTILFVMMAFILDIRIFGEHSSERFTEAKSENLPLEDFRHVVIENLRNIKISPSESNHIYFVTYNDTTTINISYAVENDTLKISRTPSSSDQRSYTLYTSTTIESISTKDSKIRLSGFNQDSIYLNISGGEISSLERNDSDFSNFKKVKITGLNSRIYFWDVEIDTLEIDIEKSRAEFRKDINTVNASVKSKSQLHLKNVEKLELVKDADSRIYMR